MRRTTWKIKLMQEADMPTEHHAVPMTRDEEWKYAERSMSWDGWGSPIGLGFMLIALGIASLLLRFAIVGF